MASNLSELSVAEIAGHVIRGELRAEDYAAQALERYRAQRELNAITWIDEARVLEEARAVDLRRSRGERLGRLAGVPLVIKDNIDVAGMPTAAATRALQNHIARNDALAVLRLREQDAVMFGKANMHELALGCTSSNLATGIVRNPYDRTRVPGGSSGGTAAAIAARIVPAGLGTDTAGSVRIPAAFCGTAALRPTSFDRRPLHGVVPLAELLDTVGPMARTVRDVALVHCAVTRGAGAQAANLDGMRLGVPRRYYWTNLQSGVAQVMEGALSRLRAAGAELVEVDVRGYYALASEVYMTFIMHGLKTDLRAYLERTGRSFEEVLAQVQSADVRAMFERAAQTEVSADQVARAREISVHRIAPAYRELFHRNAIAALAFPTVAVEAPPVREGGDTLDDLIEIEGNPFNAVLALIRNTHVTAVIGAPAASVPAGLTAHALPVGFELDGLPGEDDVLLGLGIAVEQTLGDLRPPPALARA
jgi:Asp-tRNA(Asn)/Glu-tRNA(Gln) amidotransferase A subunit family amidase